MPKRYVDSDQFIDPWFRKLTPEGKLFWVFLCSSCDPSGVWERDDDYSRYLTGLESSVDELLKTLGDRVKLLGKNKVLLPKFILFQQGVTLFPNKPPHKGILKLLEKHGLNMDAEGITMPILKQGLSKAKVKVRQSLTKAKAKVNQSLTKPLVTSSSNGSSIVNNKEGSVRGTISDLPPELDDLRFHAAWADWEAYRSERKMKPYVPLGLAALRKRLAVWVKNHGILPVIHAINASIANNWQGLFEPNEKEESSQPSRDYENALDY